MLEITKTTAEPYLRERSAVGQNETVAIHELSGGVSNTVLLVHRPEFPGGDFVLKQALPRLKVKQEWLCGIERIWREVEVLEICRQLLASRGRQHPDSHLLSETWRICIPRILFSDRDNYCYAMSAAPAAHRTWKELLLGGQADPALAATCGELLGSLHGLSWGNSDIARRLDDRSFFDALRLDPYYRRVATVHPDLATIMNRLVDDTYATRRALVHGDFSPKNLLVSPGQLWLIDFEVGHFGDPAFDLGFFLTHLALKAIHFHPRQDEYLLLIDSFWNSYRARIAPLIPHTELSDLSRRAAIHWAACMLARVDGKSPVEYLTPGDQRDVRSLTKSLLLDLPCGISEFRRRFPPLPAPRSSA